MKGELSNCLDPISGQIQVDSEGRVTNIHPIAPNPDAAKKVYDNIFSFGDVCITRANELKTIVSMYQYKHVYCHNIIKTLQGQSDFE